MLIDFSEQEIRHIFECMDAQDKYGFQGADVDLRKKLKQLLVLTQIEEKADDKPGKKAT